MKKQFYVINLMVLSLLVIFVWQDISYAASETYVTKKIKLGDYKQQNGKPTSGTYSVHWWDLENVHFAVDENHKVYVLDIYNKKVLQLSPEANLVKEIVLKGIEFPYTNKNIDDGSMIYPIEVSSDGNFIYVVGGSEEYNWTIFKNDGVLVKKNVHRMEFYRTCNGRFVSGREILDNNLNSVGKFKGSLAKPKLVSDSEDNLYLLNLAPKYMLKTPFEKPYLTKKTPDGKQIWKKEINGHKKALGILGTDSNNNIYVLMDGSLGIVKLNKEDGEQIERISLPSDLTYTNKEWKWNNFRVLCDGTVYYFPPTKQNKGSKSKGLNEYAIYIFEKM